MELEKNYNDLLKVHSQCCKDPSVENENDGETVEATLFSFHEKLHIERFALETTVTLTRKNLQELLPNVISREPTLKNRNHIVKILICTLMFCPLFYLIIAELLIRHFRL